jgi:hypothetical protein
MLVFGAPILMRKSINQQFTIIELKLLLEKIEILLKHEFNSDIEFNINNLIDFSIMLGTDYGTVKTNENFLNSKELLKYYVINDKDYKKIISPDQYENFETIKKYYTIQDFENLNFDITKKPVWNKPKLMELKKRLLELYVDEDYIDKNNEFIDLCYNRIKKGKNIFKNNYNNNDFFMSMQDENNQSTHKVLRTFYILIDGKLQENNKYLSEGTLLNYYPKNNDIKVLKIQILYSN